mmetsp:Transcript_52023/g.58995  ORF Transcript_52023/g.58995 Transcript_52023/m.58995 type:complete len:689 (+) Transcript_52023:146-2212(+)
MTVRTILTSTTTTTTNTALYGYSFRIPGRKRTFTSRFRRACITASAVTFSSSFVLAFAFQQNFHFNPSRSHSRLSTASRVQVLTDSNNLVMIEQNTIADRAVLEELYILSPSAKKSIINTDEGRIEKKYEYPTIAGKKCRSNKSSEDMFRPIVVAEDQTTKGRKIDFCENQSELTPVYSAKASNVQFKGLTTGPPNRKNRRKSLSKDLVANTKNCIPSLGVVTGYDDVDYIRSILRKKEESFEHDQTAQRRHPLATASSPLEEDTSPHMPVSTANTKSSFKSVPKSLSTFRSSTMPGFIERTNTNRLKAYRDGIKIIEQQSGEKFVDSAEAKRKRVQANGKEMYKTSVSVPDSLVQFANEIHDVDRITPKEEISLGEKTQEAIRLQNIYDGLVANLDREPTDDEWCAAAGKFNMESISQTIYEGLEAKDKLVTSNLRMVQGVVNVYIRNGLNGQYNAGDLMQEGILALIRAAEKFDPTRGFRFSTYAMYWIRSAIKRDQLSQSRIVPIPQRLHEKSKRINLIGTELKELLNRHPTNTELSDAVGMSEVQIERCQTAISQKFYSLDQKMVNRMKANNMGENTDTMYSIIRSKTDDNELDLDHMFLREDLIKALRSHLSEEEASIIMLRFGMDGDMEQSSPRSGGRTISEVSKMIGLKPDKVRRTINRSLKQLQVLVGKDFEYYNRDLNL